jgi:hypothetical protein
MELGSGATVTDRAYVHALGVATRPALVAACGQAALAVLVGVALVLSVWKGLPATASIIATGGLLTCASRGQARRQSTLTASTTAR